MRTGIKLMILLLILFQACDLINMEEPLAIDGMWIWNKAEDTDGDDLMKKQEYQSCTFYLDGTYAYYIDSTMVAGEYEVDENNTILRLDHSNIWEILSFSDSSFVLYNLNGTKHKWELKKFANVTR
jgi:hypothetical protein